MTASSYPAAKAFREQEEGLYSSDKSDPGNWSSGKVNVGTFIGSYAGFSAPVVIAWMAKTEPGFVVTAAWMENLPSAVGDGIDQAEYWEPMNCDNLPSGLDLIVYDSGFNIGPSTSAKQFQGLIGAVQDGNIGPVTLGLIDTVSLAPIAKALSAADAITMQTLLSVDPDGDVGPLTLAAIAAQPSIRVPILILRLGEIQAAYYRSLTAQSEDLDGWLNRVGARVSAALALVTQPTAKTGTSP